MFWTDEVVADLSGPQVVNDSKTPSGRVHVGALRGVLIHDSVYRALRQRDIPAKYLFGVDDYDPLDELPAGAGEDFQRYLGVPICNVPSPDPTVAPDMAEYYIRGFFEIFKELAVGATTYRMRDIYRSGRFNSAIDRILSSAHVVRRVDLEMANVRRAHDWYPFQVVCEGCGRLGTTKVTDYDGEEVTYRCEPALVRWASGCGRGGRISPFFGNGKLPWKLEWVAKWHEFGVTVEGAGKDHNTRGGSRAVAVRCLEEIFGDQPPVNVPYEFFLVGGSKMSSSRGVGVSAREMADFLPPEVLRFLIIRTHPRKTVNFAPTEARVVTLFNDFDSYRERASLSDGNSSTHRQIYSLSQVQSEDSYWVPPFSLVLSLLQMPHLDPFAEAARLKGSSLTQSDLHHLRLRLKAGDYWLRHFAKEEERILLQPELPDRAKELSPAQISFLHELASALERTEWSPEEIQARIFEIARSISLDQGEAFQALYRVLFNRDSGPRAGNLLAFLDQSFVVGRLREVQFMGREIPQSSHQEARSKH